MQEAGGFTPNLDYRVQDFISAIGVASAGHRVAVVPESMQNFFPSGVVYKRIADFKLSVELVLAHRQREISPAVRAFVQLGIALSKPP